MSVILPFLSYSVEIAGMGPENEFFYAWIDAVAR